MVTLLFNLSKFNSLVKILKLGCRFCNYQSQKTDIKLNNILLSRSMLCSYNVIMSSSNVFRGLKKNEIIITFQFQTFDQTECLHYVSTIHAQSAAAHQLSICTVLCLVLTQLNLPALFPSLHFIFRCFITRISVSLAQYAFGVHTTLGFINILRWLSMTISQEDLWQCGRIYKQSRVEFLLTGDPSPNRKINFARTHMTEYNSTTASEYHDSTVQTCLDS